MRAPGQRLAAGHPVGRELPPGGGAGATLGQGPRTPAPPRRGHAAAQQAWRRRAEQVAQQQGGIDRQVPGDQRPHRRGQQVDALAAADVVDQQAEQQAQHAGQPPPLAAPGAQRAPARQQRVQRLEPAQPGLRPRRQKGLGRGLGADRLQRTAAGPGAVLVGPAREAGGLEGAQQQHLAGGAFVHVQSRRAVPKVLSAHSEDAVGARRRRTVRRDCSSPDSPPAGR